MRLVAYGEGVSTVPSQSAQETAAAGFSGPSGAIEAGLFDELWRESEAASYGLRRGEFERILERIGTAKNFGQPPGDPASRRQQADYFHALKLADLVLARACAEGHEGAWERFLALYRQPLSRAAMAITGSETLGRDLADQLYAELYGLTTRDGERRCPLESYQGRGSLIGWLRTTLAQRHVDHHRRTYRELPLDEPPEGFEPVAASPEEPAGELARLSRATEEALRGLDAEDRLLLAAYYMDGRTLAEIGRVLHAHEATVSRKLRRLTGGLRKQVLKNLQRLGLSRQAAQEALGADPRDLDLNLKKMLQNPQPEPFQGKAAR